MLTFIAFVLLTAFLYACLCFLTGCIAFFVPGIMAMGVFLSLGLLFVAGYMSYKALY